MFLFPLFPCFLGPQDLLRRAPGALQGPSRHPPGPSRHPPGHLGAQNAPTRLSAEILLSMSLRGTLFEGFEGEMARDISKMTFKKLIEFRKSILLFRNAPRILPSTFPGLEIYEVCVSQTPMFFGFRSSSFEHISRFGRQPCATLERQQFFPSPNVDFAISMLKHNA